MANTALANISFSNTLPDLINRVNELVDTVNILNANGTSNSVFANSANYALEANNSAYLNGQAPSYYLNASNLSSGTVPSARLGTGTANTTTFLRGDGVWAVFTADSSTPGLKLDSFAASFNGSQTVFNLLSGGGAIDPGGQNNLIISVDGVIQEPNVAFTSTGTTITFTEAPATGASFFGIAMPTGVVNQNATVDANGLMSFANQSFAGVKTFTSNSIVSNTVPAYILSESDQATDGKRWALYVSGGTFALNPTLDDGTLGTNALVATRGGAITIPGSLGVTGLITGRTVTPIFNSDTGAQNNWAPTGIVVGHTYVIWTGASNVAITGIAGGTTGQIFTFLNQGASIATFAFNSGSSSVGNKLINAAISAATPVAAGGWIQYFYDAAGVWRMVAHDQGAWITPTFSAGDYTAVGAMTWTVASGDVTWCAYRICGKTLHFNYMIDTTTVGGTANSQLVRSVPGGFNTIGYTDHPVVGLDNLTVAPDAFCRTSHTANTIVFFKNLLAANWTLCTNLTYVHGHICVEVQ